ncbi:FAD-binding protein [Hasllibacter sp. MH4015]|uniref:FAD-binding protein n=1 Tax=Hasllibacter sp. MH4015 TaxID=2854029 RepID=UPI001CD8032E|nr:FAD-binding protein [Hasllibacter sp. MH4015]
MSPASETELAEMIAGAAAPLRIRGGGTRSIGAAGAGEVLRTDALSGVELYEPGALTLVVRAGTPLEEVETLLAEEGQMLPFEPPRMAGVLGRDGVSTIGGVVAANASGPRRFQAGACRDALIGVRFVDGTGSVLKNGGRVMKNVTGYDLVKLMAGSWGTLGVLSEVAFKVLPKLNGATLRVHGVEGARALDAMTRAVTSPFDVNGAALVPGEGAYLRVEGLETSVTYRIGKLKDLLGDLGEIEVIDDPEASAALWRDLRDVARFADGTAALWRISMKASDMVATFLSGPLREVAFDYQLDWAGGLAWVRLSEDAAAHAATTLGAGGTGAEAGIVAFHRHLQNMCRAQTGGHATLFRAPDSVLSQVDVFQPEAAGVARLSAGLRAKFDPRGILNPGLMGT